MDCDGKMSEAKLLLKVELVNGNPKVTLGTGHTALLSLALQCVDIEVKYQILRQSEIASQEQMKSSILKPGSDIQVPDSLIGKL